MPDIVYEVWVRVMTTYNSSEAEFCADGHIEDGKFVEIKTVKQTSTN